jgi:hypothetical protein
MMVIIIMMMKNQSGVQDANDTCLPNCSSLFLHCHCGNRIGCRDGANNEAEQMLLMPPPHTPLPDGKILLRCAEIDAAKYPGLIVVMLTEYIHYCPCQKPNNNSSSDNDDNSSSYPPMNGKR